MPNLNNYIKPNQKTSGVLAITGAAPITVNGVTLPMGAIEAGTLSAKVAWNVTTTNITFVARWQVSDDGSTFVDCAGTPNNPAEVAFATGTGSLVTSSKCFPAPSCAYGKLFCRLKVVSGVGVGGGATVDDATITYDYRLARG